MFTMENMKTKKEFKRKEHDVDTSIFGDAVMTAIASTYAHSYRVFDMNFDMSEQVEDLESINAKSNAAALDLFEKGVADYMHHTYDKLDVITTGKRRYHAFTEMINDDKGNRVIMITLYSVIDNCGYAAIYTLHENREKPVAKHDVICILEDKSDYNIQQFREYYESVLANEIPMIFNRYLQVFLNDYLNPKHPYTQVLDFSPEEVNMIKYAYKTLDEDQDLFDWYRPVIGVVAMKQKEYEHDKDLHYMFEGPSDTEFKFDVCEPIWDPITLSFEMSTEKMLGALEKLNKGEFIYRDIFSKLEDRNLNTFDMLYPLDSMVPFAEMEEVVQTFILPPAVKIHHMDDKLILSIKYSFADKSIIMTHTIKEDAKCDGKIMMCEIVYSPASPDGIYGNTDEVYAFIKKKLMDTGISAMMFTLIISGFILLQASDDDFRLCTYLESGYKCIVHKDDLDKFMKSYSDARPTIVDSENPWYEAIGQIEEKK